MEESNIRNFVIIAHIDAGKSTLADRFLEITGTVEPRKMKPQYLDQLELERERGITIKMAPVRMAYHSDRETERNITRNVANNFRTNSHFNSQSFASSSKFILNLIDTPGHSDFAYEVSRALAAVEGAILLVDVTKGIQAQTLSNFRMAAKAGLKIIGAVNKIDLLRTRTDADNNAELRRKIKELADLIGDAPEEIHKISGKTGEGVKELLEAAVRRIPAPKIYDDNDNVSRTLIFDSLYDDHKGIIAFVRVFGGEFKPGDGVQFIATGKKTKIKEVGYFIPELKPVAGLSAGEIGYIATGLKEPAAVKIGDTIIANNRGTTSAKFRESPHINSQSFASLALPGYKEPLPVVFVSFYPDAKTKFEDLKAGLERLRLTDSALTFEPDSSEALGRGLKVGFLGQLHFEITASRLEREFGLEFMTSFPSVAYRVKRKGKVEVIRDPNDFPADPDFVFQPMINLEIFAPADKLGQLMTLKEHFHLEMEGMQNIGDNVIIRARMPLAELMRDFDDKLKSISAGFASFNYELVGEAATEVEKLEILVNGEIIPALTRIVFRAEVEKDGRAAVERLKEILPRQQFSQAIQAKAGSRIIARETAPALRKDVTGYLYGGDRTRKMKLWKKQKAGKEKLKKLARIKLAPEVFREFLKR